MNSIFFFTPQIALPGKTFVLKTENGSYQIVQLCPSPATNSGVGQNNAVAAIRLAVPAVSWVHVQCGGG